MSTAAEPIIVTVEVPHSAHDDRSFIQALLEQQAAKDGLVLVGDTTLELRDPAGFEVDGKMIYPFGDMPMVRAECKAKPKPAPAELAAFVPASETVERVARSLHAPYATKPWDDLPAPVRNKWAMLALDVIVKASSDLIADAVTHVAEHRAQYGLTEAPFAESMLRDVAKRAREQASQNQD